MLKTRHILDGSPYQGYTYAYPHKTAYRSLEPAPSLEDVWAQEAKEQLFLYVHIPFCEMRCGFCNLFTTVNSGEDVVRSYLKALEREAWGVARALGPAKFSRLALGGGTPTYLHPDELFALFATLEKIFGIRCDAIPISVETSPATASKERMDVLDHYAVDRVSIGVQSFVESEVRALGRAQDSRQLHKALETIRDSAVPHRNIDLIYGIPEQSPDTWLRSLREALAYEPEEIYLYPLYVRPLTGLGKKEFDWDDQRLNLYRIGRDFLLSEGYQQISMRMFQKPIAEPIAPRTNTKDSPPFVTSTATKHEVRSEVEMSRRGDNRASYETSRTIGSSIESSAKEQPIYCCQDDGMVGLGCGARSYTKSLHYSHEYAVARSSIQNILAEYRTRPEQEFALAKHGFRLSLDEQRRRFLLQSLLQKEGLDLKHYAERFGTRAMTDYPELEDLPQRGLAALDAHRLRLTAKGLEYSDAIGPWLYSASVQSLIAGYELR